MINIYKYSTFYKLSLYIIFARYFLKRIILIMIENYPVAYESHNVRGIIVETEQVIISWIF